MRGIDGKRERWDVVLNGGNKDSERCGRGLDDEICRELDLEGVFFEEMI